MLRKVKWVRAPLGIFGLDVATTKEIMDGEGSITLVNQLEIIEFNCGLQFNEISIMFQSQYFR